MPANSLVVNETYAERDALLVDLTSRLRAQEAEWAACVADEATSPEPVLRGRGWVCRVGNLALCVRPVAGGREYVPVAVTPLLAGFSRLTLEEAEHVAAAHPGGYRVEHVHDICRNRLAEVRATLGRVEVLASEHHA
jgi:hypothetical protein